MPKPAKAPTFVGVPQLTFSEQQAIDQKIELETVKSFHRMVRFAVFANILSAFFYVLTIYHSTDSVLIISWYVFLCVLSLFLLLWAHHFEFIAPSRKEILKFRKGFFSIVTLICLIWSSIGILFVSTEINQQMTTLLFLSAILICFAFATAIDLSLGVLSIVCIITPTILYHLYLSPFFVFTPLSKV